LPLWDTIIWGLPRRLRPSDECGLLVDLPGLVEIEKQGQHEKHKAGNRKDGQRKQNTTNHCCPSSITVITQPLGFGEVRFIRHTVRRRLAGWQGECGHRERQGHSHCLCPLTRLQAGGGHHNAPESVKHR
jgi:hypothetical protein